jgi:SAM-dependent methyltransferase
MLVPCGSEPAREGGVSVNIDVECIGLFASRLAQGDCGGYEMREGECFDFFFTLWSLIFRQQDYPPEPLHMSAQPPSAIELELARRYDQEHARVCQRPQPRGLMGRLALRREKQLVRNALKVAGEPGLILDAACGTGRFWPVLAEHGNRVILACAPSPDMLDHARTHHPQVLLERIKTFQSSVFAIGLPTNAVDCIFCMELFRHINRAEDRLAMLAEFHRVSRDTVIIAVELQGRFARRPATAQALARQPLAIKAEVEAGFRRAGFSLLSHQDFFPGCASLRIYVLRKAG